MYWSNICEVFVLRRLIVKVENSRIYFFDNVKALLLFLVIFGHMLELFLTGKIGFIYKFIYLFHIPLFCICSGYFAKDRPKRVIKNILYPYITFQLLYWIFNRVNLGQEVKLTYTTPFWIMWYVLALFVWMLIFPLLKATIEKVGIIVTLLLLLILGIIAGFDETINYHLSLSRILYFLPFFAIGVCVKSAVRMKTFFDFLSKWYVKLTSGILACAVLIWLCFSYKSIAGWWLYGAMPYDGEGHYFTTRVWLYLCAMILSIFVLSLMPRRKMFFSYIGMGTIQGYLMHGFVVILLRKYEVFNNMPNQLVRLLVAGVMALIITFVFTTKPVAVILQPLLSPDWITSLVERGKVFMSVTKNPHSDK